MSPHLLLQLVLIACMSFEPQKSGSPEKQGDYLVLEIRGKEDQSPFEFEGDQLMRQGKESVLHRLDGKAPFKLSLNESVFLILRGKSGEGKVGMRYRVGKEEKRSFQYLNAGEAIVISFGTPGVGVSWREGDMAGFSRLTVNVWKKE